MTQPTFESLAFLLLGVPLAYVVERLIARLTWETDLPEAGFRRRLLPWQIEPGASVLRGLAAACVPFLTVAAALRFDGAAVLSVSLVLVALLICATTDLLCYRIPNAVTYPGLAFTLICPAVFQSGDLLDAVAGAIAATGVFLPISYITRGGLGFADVKLAIFIGAALGLARGFEALLLGVTLGGVVMLLLLVARMVKRGQVTPYAPFLALSAIAVTLERGTAFAPL